MLARLSGVGLVGTVGAALGVVGMQMATKHRSCHLMNGDDKNSCFV